MTINSAHYFGCLSANASAVSCHSEHSEESISRVLLSNKDSSATSFPQNDVKRAAFTSEKVFSPHSASQRKCASQFIRDFAGVTSRSTRRAGFAHAHAAPYLKIGFTLAEVLVTLGIIGVVAAMTLPSLASGKQKKELQTGLKKGYTVISQALMTLNAEKGYIANRSNYGNQEFIPNYKTYFTKVKDCGIKGCLDLYYSTDDGSGGVYRTYNKKKKVTTNYFDDGQFILSDGMFVMIEDNPSGPTGTLLISVDVNGINKCPNIWGHDLFTFEINNKSGALVPMGAEGTTYYSQDQTYCSKTSSSVYNGINCAYKAMTDDNYWKSLP